MMISDQFLNFKWEFIQLLVRYDYWLLIDKFFICHLFKIYYTLFSILSFLHITIVIDTQLMTRKMFKVVRSPMMRSEVLSDSCLLWSVLATLTFICTTIVRDQVVERNLTKPYRSCRLVEVILIDNTIEGHFLSFKKERYLWWTFIQ